MSGDLFNSGWDNIFNPLSNTVLDMRASPSGTTSVGREKEMKERRLEALDAAKEKAAREAEKRKKQLETDALARDEASRTALREATTGGYAANVLTGGAGLTFGSGSAASRLYGS